MYHEGDKMIVLSRKNKEEPVLASVTNVCTENGQVIYDYNDKFGNPRRCPSEVLI